MPFVDLKAQQRRLGGRIRARIDAVLGHREFILGPEVTELEAALARFTGAAHAIGVSSGTDALLIALMAEGIGAGAAVFMPAFGFAATAEVALALGAEPVFVDVEPESFNIDAQDLDRRVGAVLTAGRLAPAAVIAVDLFGLPADYAALENVARRHRLLVLADAAQSFGGRIGEVPVGRLAPVTATSFYPSKPLGCYGDGGAIFTGDDDRAARMRSIRVHGQGADPSDIVRLGVNGRLDTLQAAILLAKLEVFAEELAARETLAALYDQGLKDLVAAPPRIPGRQCAWAVYSILTDRRDQLRQALAGEGIPTMTYYPRPLHLQPAFERYGDGMGSLPISEGLCARILSLPMHPYMDRDTAGRIIDAVARALK
ncbi:MAG: DegT/DnrJ/EryC1/StrS aminotransferase family protein [Proteobacteria bacterium]|nr:DegT/DnrJ/EryC1/StrS aminotransferase family protein [Pseudomonadota bacterium]